MFHDQLSVVLFQKWPTTESYQGEPSTKMMKSLQRSADSVAAELQASSGFNISTKALHRELHAKGLCGRAAPAGVMCMWLRVFVHMLYFL